MTGIDFGVPTFAPAVSALDATPMSLAERAIKAVRGAVRSGALIPGELYSVYRIAEQLGISRSPVREALLRLAETGMIKFERNRGFRVVLPTPHDIAEIFAIRLALEVPAVRRATLQADIRDRRALRQQYAAMEEAAQIDDEPTFEHHDQKLHALLIDIEGNNRTKNIINNLRDATRLVGASTVRSDRSLLEVLVDHLPIVEAFEAANPEAAAIAMDCHLRTTGRLLLSQALRQSGKQDEELAIWEQLID
ncbi:GntR family transcriptional regulator [Arthrobacter sp. CAN_C5]|uniref:GntR family transcriptional regulator n=1 Tax=Arthrobacter sp. CAN_C5 TaxID=2760706 RepID=UPI001AE158A8|nr:GntR family transcriptional regulator [Arthrobacter sp. CAN_C5]MBP2215122.1 DNA-binding GntR family transcriptional regulator [Arthrobacter sp. CAN_C5]